MINSVRFLEHSARHIEEQEKKGELKMLEKFTATRIEKTKNIDTKKVAFVPTMKGKPTDSWFGFLGPNSQQLGHVPFF